MKQPETWSDYLEAIPPTGFVELPYDYQTDGESYLIDYYTRYRGRIYNLALDRKGGYEIFELTRGGDGEAVHNLKEIPDHLVQEIFPDLMMETLL